MPITTTIATDTGTLADQPVDTLLVGAFAAPSPDNGGESAGATQRQPPVLAADAAAVADVLGVDLAAEIFAAGFEGQPGSLARIPTRGTISAGTITVVGLGAAAQLTAARLSAVAAQAARALGHHTTVATSLHQAAIQVPTPTEADPDAGSTLDLATAVRAVGEGLLLGAYRFDAYRSKASNWRLERFVVVDGDAAAAAPLAVAVQVAHGVAQARDLVNLPPQDKRPPQLAQLAVDAAVGLPIDVRVLDEDDLAEGGYGGILGVGQGSSMPPRLVELRYRPDHAQRHVALVGKGITFDSGGLSLKPSTAMETMKCDMAGAAAVLATVVTAAQLGLPVEITGLLALAENMPSGTATRVSDVLTMRGGTTVEVINTDAEGRLVLADALVHASELEPDAIVDLATLTGAQVVALGERISALVANNDDLSHALVAAGDQAGEMLWPLPLGKTQYGERVNGTIADLKNVGNRAAGVIFGALFLERFVGTDIAWAHLDIAGPAWTDEVYGEYTKGGTGTPVRALIAWLQAGIDADAR